MPPAQWYSCKVANQAKLPSYFQYLAKGPHAEHHSGPQVMVDLSKSRMWSELHEAFHKVAEEIRERKANGVSKNWYLQLAEQCREKGARTKDDVLEVVSRYYVYESKKGFDKFAVTRTFWAVYSLVHADDAHAHLLEQCKRMLEV